MSEQITPADWADALAQRAGTDGLIKWLPELARWLGDVSFSSWLSINENGGRITVTSRARGMAFTLTPTSGYYLVTPQIRASLLVLDNVVFDARRIAELSGQSALPFGLFIQGETAQTAAKKIGTTDTTEGTGAAGERISYFLDDLRVVELTFSEDSRISRVLVTRLWQPIEFEQDTLY